MVLPVSQFGINRDLSYCWEFLHSLAQMNYVRVKTMEVVAHGTVPWTELTANGTGLDFATAVGIMGFIAKQKYR